MGIDNGNAHTASEWDMALLAMVYLRDEMIKEEYNTETIKHAARLGAELGADVEIFYTGSDESCLETAARYFPDDII